ncbi:uncharacterized protein BDR25DRAFT_227734, partial [Lindgomyces ingoldianus]
IVMTTIHHSPPPGVTPFSIFEDSEDQGTSSPSEVYDGDTSFNSETFPGADEPIESIEHQELVSYRSSYTSRPSILSAGTSRRASLISSLPSELSISSKPIPPTGHGVNSRNTPRKERPLFRNSSSVRAMQMSSPPPLAHFESPRDRLKGVYKLATPSKSGRSETPTSVMPDWLVENYKLLEEKLKDIVLMRRGLLIPHPREEYDLLEERILESLDLKTPRLLKCGHFIGPGEGAEEKGDEEEDRGSVMEGRSGRETSMSGGTVTGDDEPGWKYPTPESDNASVCIDCHRQVKRPGNGIGTGTKRWDLKIYAANGLMRAGAWSAAWSEMERCDVEISPWIPEDMRKLLEKQAEERQRAENEKRMYEAEVMRRVEEEAARMKKLEADAEEKRRVEEAERQKKIEEEELSRQGTIDKEAAEKRELNETLKEKIEEVKESIRLEFEAQILAEANAVSERVRLLEEKLKNERSKPINFEHPLSRGRPRAPSRRPSSMDDVPISTLLRNYLVLLARDRRNIVIVILSAFVVFLAMHVGPSLAVQTLPPIILSTFHEDYSPDPISSIVATTTATLTATSIISTTITLRVEETPSAAVLPSVQLVSSEVISLETTPVVESTHITGEIVEASLSRSEPASNKPSATTSASPNSDIPSRSLSAASLSSALSSPLQSLSTSTMSPHSQSFMASQSSSASSSPSWTGPLSIHDEPKCEPTSVPKKPQPPETPSEQPIVSESVVQSSS